MSRVIAEPPRGPATGPGTLATCHQVVRGDLKIRCRPRYKGDKGRAHLAPHNVPKVIDGVQVKSLISCLIKGSVKSATE